MLNCHIDRFESLGHIYRFYNRILFSECKPIDIVSFDKLVDGIQSANSLVVNAEKVKVGSIKRFIFFHDGDP